MTRHGDHRGHGGLPGMVVPPVDEHGVIPASRFDYEDRRLPERIGRYSDDEREIHPLGYWMGDVHGGPCSVVVGGDRQRHLFDALYTSGSQHYDDKGPLPVEMRMVFTCVRCGVVIRVAGQAASDEDGGVHHVATLDPVPLQVGALMAQQIRADHGWTREVDATWAVYAEGRRVGMIADARGQRGRRYAHGRLGDDGPLLEGPTALAVLRKLDRQLVAAQPAVR